MWSMWDAPSDRDYLDQINPEPDDSDDPDNVLQPEPEPEPLPDLGEPSF